MNPPQASIGRFDPDVLDLLADLARETVVIVVTHEPQLFSDWDCHRCQLMDGELKPVTTLPAR